MVPQQRLVRCIRLFDGSAAARWATGEPTPGALVAQHLLLAPEDAGRVAIHLGQKRPQRLGRPEALI